MSTSIELHNVVAVQINDTVVAKNTTTTWRELHFHKVNGEIVTLTLYPHRKGSSIPVTFGDDEFNFGDDEFNPNEGE
jgi:hypothetical protein